MLPPPVHSTNSRVKHNPSPPVTKAIYLARASAWETGFRFPTYLEAREHKAWRHHLCIPPWLFTTFWWEFIERSLNTQSGVPVLATVTQGTILDLPASRNNDCGHIELYTFTYYKGWCLRVWLSINLKFSDKQDSSPWNTDRTWYTLNNKATYLRQKSKCFT